MITFVAVALLALIAFAYAALPLLSPRHADPLPDDTDPVLAGLEEEKAALLRAIAELDAREDLAAERREQLRRRYEAKAAATIKALDARRAAVAARGRRGTAPAASGTAAPSGAGDASALAGGSPATVGQASAPAGESPAPPGESPAPGGESPAPAGGAAPARPRRAPVAAVALLAFAVATAAFLPSYVLPRVGLDATVTTTDAEAARLIRDLRRAADREPTAENLVALGDAYLSVGELEDARAAYLRAAEADDASLPVFQRLTVLALQTDLGEAQSWLERAAAVAPEDAETLFLLSEVAYANGDMETSEGTLRRYVDLVGGPPNETVAARLELFARVDGLAAAAEADPSEENLLALADLYWRAGDVRSAAGAYVRVLTELNPQQPVALSRMGEALLASGAPSDAAALLERAAAAGGGLEPSAQLALGEAYVRLGRFDEAVAVLEAYQASGGDDPVAAELLASARAGTAPGAAGGDLAAVAGAGGQGAVVFAANCAECHGPMGEGGMGAALAGNPRAANEGNVRDAVTFGRGMMPGFGATLQPDELEAVIAYVVEVVSQR